MATPRSSQTVLKDTFASELEALRSGGRALARAHPHLAHALATESADPDIERLLAGMAFLTARMRVHQNSHQTDHLLSLCEQLCPELAAPVPAATLCQLDLEPDSDPPLATVPAGTPLTRKTSEKTIHLMTRTAMATASWQPLDVQWHRTGEGQARLTWHLTGPLHLWTEESSPPPILMWLNVAPSVAQELALALTFHAERIDCQLASQRWQAPADGIVATVLDPVIAARPLAPESEVAAHRRLPDGVRLWRQFDQLPASQQFLTLDLAAILGQRPRGLTLDQPSTLEMTVHLSGALGLPLGLPADALLLNVVPADNLVTAPGMPLRLTAESGPLPLRPEGAEPDAMQVVRLVHATLLDPHSTERTPLDSQVPGGSPSGVSLLRRPSPDDGWHDAWAAMIWPSDRAPPKGVQIFSSTLLCTQRCQANLLPAGPLTPVTHPTGRFRARMVWPMSRAQDVISCQTEEQGGQPWRLVGLMPGRLQRSVTREAICELLEAALSFAPEDRIGRVQAARRRQALMQVECRRVGRVFGGSLLPTRLISLHLSMAPLSGPGEAFFVGALLAHILADGQGIGEALEVELVFIEPQRTYSLGVFCDGVAFGARRWADSSEEARKETPCSPRFY